MSTDVSGNNDKVLSILEQQLATNDPSIYRTATEKFGKWLDSPKAYYSRARPKVPRHSNDPLLCVLVRC